jgi:hypothetical protein
MHTGMYVQTEVFTYVGDLSAYRSSGASEGRRKKPCEQGAGLMNTVNGDGKALLYDVKTCSETRKDAQGIASTLSEVGCEIMGSKELAPAAPWMTLVPTVPQ